MKNRRHRRALATALVAAVLVGSVDTGGGPAARDVHTAGGIPILITWGNFNVVKVDLPDTETFRKSNLLADDGPMSYFGVNTGESSVDIGYRWEGVKVLLIPIAHWDGKWCLIMPESEEYIDASHDDCVALAHAAGMTLPSEGPGVWWTFGGKLVWLALIAFLIKRTRDSARARKELAERLASRRAARRAKASG